VEPKDLDDIASENRSVAKAREALGLAEDHPARIFSVARIKPGARGFLLIVFGTPRAAVGIATVDPASGEVLEKAIMPGSQPHLLISAVDAIQRAGLDTRSEATLVWEPVGASHSPFYPLWQLDGQGRTVWVDSVRGTVWNNLYAARGGGAVPD
jgi:hypothetical protein